MPNNNFTFAVHHVVKDGTFYEATITVTDVATGQTNSVKFVGEGLEQLKRGFEQELNKAASQHQDLRSVMDQTVSMTSNNSYVGNHEYDPPPKTAAPVQQATPARQPTPERQRTTTPTQPTPPPERAEYRPPQVTRGVLDVQQVNELETREPSDKIAVERTSEIAQQILGDDSPELKAFKEKPTPKTLHNLNEAVTQKSHALSQTAGELGQKTTPLTSQEQATLKEIHSKKSIIHGKWDEIQTGADIATSNLEKLDIHRNPPTLDEAHRGTGFKNLKVERNTEGGFVNLGSGTDKHIPSKAERMAEGQRQMAEYTRVNGAPEGHTVGSVTSGIRNTMAGANLAALALNSNEGSFEKGVRITQLGGDAFTIASEHIARHAGVAGKMSKGFATAAPVVGAAVDVSVQAAMATKAYHDAKNEGDGYAAFHAQNYGAIMTAAAIGSTVVGGGVAGGIAYGAVSEAAAEKAAQELLKTMPEKAASMQADCDRDVNLGKVNELAKNAESLITKDDVAVADNFTKTHEKNGSLDAMRQFGSTYNSAYNGAKSDKNYDMRKGRDDVLQANEKMKETLSKVNPERVDTQKGIKAEQQLVEIQQLKQKLKDRPVIPPGTKHPTAEQDAAQKTRDAMMVKLDAAEKRLSEYIRADAIGSAISNAKSQKVTGADGQSNNVELKKGDEGKNLQGIAVTDQAGNTPTPIVKAGSELAAKMEKAKTAAEHKQQAEGHKTMDRITAEGNKLIPGIQQPSFTPPAPNQQKLNIPEPTAEKKAFDEKLMQSISGAPEPTKTDGPVKPDLTAQNNKPKVTPGKVTSTPDSSTVAMLDKDDKQIGAMQVNYKPGTNEITSIDVQTIDANGKNVSKTYNKPEQIKNTIDKLPQDLKQELGKQRDMQEIASKHGMKDKMHDPSKPAPDHAPEAAKTQQQQAAANPTRRGNGGRV